MKTLTISLRTIRQAMKRAGQHSDDWQAELLEILRIPAIAKRWAELNSGRARPARRARGLHPWHPAQGTIPQR